MKFNKFCIRQHILRFGWSVGRLIGRSVGRIIGWLVGRIIGRLVGRSGGGTRILILFIGQDDREIRISGDREIGRWGDQFVWRLASRSVGQSAGHNDSFLLDSQSVSRLVGW